MMNKKLVSVNAKLKNIQNFFIKINFLLKAYKMPHL